MNAPEHCGVISLDRLNLPCRGVLAGQDCRTIRHSIVNTHERLFAAEVAGDAEAATQPMEVPLQWRRISLCSMIQTQGQGYRPAG
jgi:hypothetical protein